MSGAARLALASLALAASLALTARGGGAQPPKRAEPAARRVVSNDGGWVVEYRVVRGAIALGESFDLEVRVLDPGRDLAPADVRLAVDADMPEHGHGMNRRVLLAPLGTGAFRAEGLRLFMPGLWELYFDVTRGPWTERAQDSVVLE